jgi:hypothetical protein
MKVNPIVSSAVRMARELGFKRIGRGDYRYGPGKFEGTDWTVAYWYDQYMNGCTESLGTCEVSELNADERAAFGVHCNSSYAVLTFSESGFVDLFYAHQATYDRLVAYAEEEGCDE